MHAIEEAILSEIERTSKMSNQSAEELNALPLGTLSPEFYTHPVIKSFCQQHRQVLGLRLLIEEYLASDRSQKYLNDIETAIQILPSPLDSKEKILQNKAAGTYLRPVPSDLIVRIYQLEDDNLNKLCQKHFSTPPIHLFSAGAIPKLIQRRQEAVLATMAKMDISASESIAIRLQRGFRRKKRHQEEVNRLSEIRRLEQEDPSQSQSLGNNQTPEQMTQWAEELIQDASTPYTPQCEPELSARIMTAAKKVAAFTTVKHITSEHTIQSIFNDAFYGRRTLINHYLNFSPAALVWTDVRNGDLNVVCLGPQKVDPGATGSIVIELDLNKVLQNKPTSFYKQRDLEFHYYEHRSIKLGSETILFNHTNFLRGEESDSSHTHLHIYKDEYDATHTAKILKSSMIAYDNSRIHEILTLNFFRFLDQIETLDGKRDPVYIANFYQKIAQLNDEELIQFLTDLERNMTDTSEFNFYGAHKIDFSTVVSVSNRHSNYTLNLSTLIDELNQGNIDKLRQARLMLPEVFKSYRFLDYLLLKVQHAETQYYLHDLRKGCEAPQWVKYTPLQVPEGFELNWSRTPRRPVVQPAKSSPYSAGTNSLFSSVLPSVSETFPATVDTRASTFTVGA